MTTRWRQIGSTRTWLRLNAGTSSRSFPGCSRSGVSRYLDFACGTARITQTVAPFAEEAIGVDISPSMLDEARRKCPKVTFVQADLTSETNDLGGFDLATAFRFFGNAQPTLREEALDVLSRLVRPGGYLIINNHRNPYSLATLLRRATGAQVVKDLSHFQLVGLLAKHRFHTIETRPIAVYMYRPRLMKKAPAVDSMVLKRERMFGHRFLAPIAPDTIIVAQRLA